MEGWMNEAHAENLLHVQLSLQHMYWNSNALLMGVKTGNNPSVKCLGYRDQILNTYTLLISVISLLETCLKE